MYGSSAYQLEAADRFSEGMRRLQAGEYHAAVYAFSAAITIDPHHWTAYFRRAEAHRQLGLEEQADSDLEKAEFLMAAARQASPEGKGIPEGTGTDISGGTIIGAFVGGTVGGIIGGIGTSIGVLFLLGVACWTGWCIVVFGPAGGSAEIEGEKRCAHAASPVSAR